MSLTFGVYCSILVQTHTHKKLHLWLSLALVASLHFTVLGCFTWFHCFVDSFDYSIEYLAWVELIASGGASSFDLFALIALRYFPAALITSYGLSCLDCFGCLSWNGCYRWLTWRDCFECFVCYLIASFALVALIAPLVSLPLVARIGLFDLLGCFCCFVLLWRYNMVLVCHRLIIAYFR